MNNKKFKDAKRTNFVVGDRVKIINASSIELYELNKVGVIVRVEDYGNEYLSYIVDMGRPRREREPEVFCWWLGEDKIELVSKSNTQLLFNFMYEE